MERTRLEYLLKEIDYSNIDMKSGIYNLNENKLQSSSGGKVEQNPSCFNESCSSGSNSSCGNGGCSGDIANSGCTNYSCS